MKANTVRSLLVTSSVQRNSDSHRNQVADVTSHLKNVSVVGVFIVALIMLVITAASALADAEVLYSGNCGEYGDTVFWSLDSDGVLTISGRGRIGEYYEEARFPWHQYRDKINTIKVLNGVTRISIYCFSSCSALTDTIHK